MSSPFLSQARTIIENADLSSTQRAFLTRYLEHVPEAVLSRLVMVFLEYPKAVGGFADYLQTLKEGKKPFSQEFIERTLVQVLEPLNK